MELGVTFKFDSAHRLMNHEGLCSHLHGHTWKVEFVFSGCVASESGMVVDFAILKGVLELHIIDFLDHAVLVNVEDYNLKAFLKGQKMRFVEVQGDPTCENLAVMLFEQAKVAVSVSLKYVKVWESETSFSQYNGNIIEE